MKKMQWIGCLSLAMILSSSLIAMDYSVQKEVINLMDLDEKAIDAFSEGKSSYILKCEEGACLPFTLTLKGDFLALESTVPMPLYLKILKSCYVRCDEKEQFLFSEDLQQWKAFTEFFTGKCEIALKAQEGGLVSSLEVELKSRKVL